MENSTNQVFALLMEALLVGEGGEGVINYSVVDSMRKFLKYILLIAKCM